MDQLFSSSLFLALRNSLQKTNLVFIQEETKDLTALHATAVVTAVQETFTTLFKNCYYEK